MISPKFLTNAKVTFMVMLYSRGIKSRDDKEKTLLTCQKCKFAEFLTVHFTGHANIAPACKTFTSFELQVNLQQSRDTCMKLSTTLMAILPLSRTDPKVNHTKFCNFFIEERNHLLQIISYICVLYHDKGKSGFSFGSGRKFAYLTSGFIC